MSRATDSPQWTKVRGKTKSGTKETRAELEARVAHGLVHAPYLARLHADVTLRELRLTEVEEGWRLMVKGDRKGRPVVAYFYASSYTDALVFAMTSIDLHGAGWSLDQWPPKRTKPPTPRPSF